MTEQKTTALAFLYRPAYFLMLLGNSWITMTTTHELGHLVAGLVTGGKLVALELRPWKLPYSMFHPNPSALVTIWSGPLAGVAVPWVAATVSRRPAAWFVANFCLLANGTYLAVAWATGDKLLDAHQLLEAGASPVTLLLFIVLTCGVGYIRFRASCIELLKPASNAAS